MNDLLKASIERYVKHRVRPGSFLCSVIGNDLYSAVIKADPENLKHLREIAVYVDENVPFLARGSYEKLLAWTGESID